MTRGSILGAVLPLASGAIFGGALAAGCTGEEFTAFPTTGGAAAGGAGGGPGGQGGMAGVAPTGGGGSSDGGAASCQSLGDPCSSCTFAACHEQYCACYAIEDCAGLVSCFDLCNPGDTACEQGCMTAHGQSIAQAFLLGDCAAESCATECPNVQALDACTRCLFQACATEMNACLANPECAAILQCVEQTCTPGDEQCPFDCAAARPDGTAQAMAVGKCMETKCGGDCT